MSTKLADKEVLIKWLASPINPLDINKIEGAYPGSEAPKIGGSEAVGVVEKVSYCFLNCNPLLWLSTMLISFLFLLLFL